MKKSDKDALIKWAETLTDEELEKEYYDSVFDACGSQIEDMYELGYDMRDIEEQRKHEKYLAEKADLLERICEKRGIKLWDFTEVEQMAELKKCPFCGGEADLCEQKHREYASTYYVRCKGCHCKSIERMGIDIVTEAWNKRATESEIRAKAIDEFAEKLVFQAVCQGCSGCCNCYELGRQMQCGEYQRYMEIVEQLKEV